MGRPVGVITKNFTLTVKHMGLENQDAVIEKVVGRSPLSVEILNGERVMQFSYKYQKSAENAVKRMHQSASEITVTYSTSISEN